METTDRLQSVRTVFPNARVSESVRPEAETAGSVARRPAGLDLDVWTHNPPPNTDTYYELNVRLCGDTGDAETSVILRDHPQPRPPRNRKPPETRTRNELNPENLERSCRRAKRNVRLAAKTLGADRILTLTSRGYLTDLTLAWAVFDEFNRLMRKRFGNRWQYVIVPELHKSGEHIHFHLAISGYLNASTVRFLWRLALKRRIVSAAHDHAPGNVDIKFKPNYQDKTRRCARYISKYISKEMNWGKVNAKRYEKSRGLEPRLIKLYAPFPLTDLEIIRKVQQLTGGALSRNPRWELYGGWDCLLIETEPPS